MTTYLVFYTLGLIYAVLIYGIGYLISSTIFDNMVLEVFGSLFIAAILNIFPSIILFRRYFI